MTQGYGRIARILSSVLAVRHAGTMSGPFGRSCICAMISVRLDLMVAHDAGATRFAAALCLAMNSALSLISIQPTFKPLDVSRNTADVRAKLSPGIIVEVT
jgi:hypothetical protein